MGNRFYVDHEPTSSTYVDDDSSSSHSTTGTSATSTFQEDEQINETTCLQSSQREGNNNTYLSINPTTHCDTTYGCTTLSASPIPSTQIHARSESKTIWRTLLTRSKYYIPVLQWLPGYSTHTFQQDLLSGLSLSSLFIPQALSYATGLCRLPAIHGLYTVSVAALVYACLGMSPELSVGPEATVSLMVGSGIAHQKAALDPEAAAAVASLTALCVGVFSLGLSLLRFGFLDSLMSRALLRGFITAVAVTVLVQQTVFLLGLDQAAKDAGITPESATLERIGFIFAHRHAVHFETASLSFAALVSLFSISSIKRRIPRFQRIPEVLLVVVLSTLGCYIFRWDQLGVEVLGQVGSSSINSPFPFPSWPSLPPGADIQHILVNAAMISTVGFVESIAAAKSFARKHNYFVSANRELFAYGSVNLVGSLFQCFPSFGSLPRSKVHEAVKPKTQMSGAVAGVCTILVTSFFMPYLYYLPSATLSSIIFMAIVALLQELPHDLQFMWKVKAWQDMFMLGIIFFTTMIYSLETGTALAVLFSLIITIRQTSYPRITIMGRVKETMYKFSPIKNPQEVVEHLEDVLIVRVDEPLHFVNTGQLKDRLRRLEHYGDLSVHPSEASRRCEDLRYVIFDTGGMESIDASAVQILHEVIESYHDRGVHVYLVRVDPNVMPLLEKSGILDLIGMDQVLQEVTDAIQAIEYDMATCSVVVHSSTP
ncbi:sulfate anion transporter [Lichtheimia corymbifera JMRC:FSU:9682]|uniref:Sulfate anion transporter n=1 Tax=Lichtheimia corymbifera JMRC:FSU:9682 TaxID=1263082 RepID=A0A068SHI7_9FUNG|nr:sulfate anion transporter [Lichtheimia corymbifera JMRC:FSU:9682]